MMPRPAMPAVALLALGACSLAPSLAAAQTGVDPLATGIYARAGYVLSSFDPSAMSFFPQRGPHDTAARVEGIHGKYFGFGEMALSGFTAGIGFDARWFFVRVGADIYEFPTITGEAVDMFRARFTTLAWVSAGPRVRVGPVVLNAGVRIGALLMNVTEVGPTRAGREYSAVDGVYALDLGVQWRPLRWFELDATVGQDFFTSTGATTFSIAASIGWSRGPAAVTRR
ncbi:MAG: hypothetical protein JWM10_1626 [Myxococcaceae bacterium]|nr:hypothetical protein [Myxococcaceae bacterium]